VTVAARSGWLWGVGVGPGDPELLTLKAVQTIQSADVIAYHSARHGRSIAREIAGGFLRGGQVEEHLVYPVTTEAVDDYAGELARFYDAAAARLAAHLDAGRHVAVLAEGDPLFYSSYMHLHNRLAHRYHTEIVPGVTSVSGASATLRRPLVEGDEVLTVLPGTLAGDDLAARLATTDAAAVLKLGRQRFRALRTALDRAGRLQEAWYVERATTATQTAEPVSDVDPDAVPYFSLVLIPSRAGTGPETPMVNEPAPHRTAGAGGEVAVVGVGPAGREWLTPDAHAALAAADELVGYSPYLDRLPLNPRQRRHPSDNRVEADRAAHALELASKGARVAVVSSGDPGVFAMAAAVYEVASEPRWHHVPVRVIPGLTAAQAVASRVGAPLGHDYCTLSLSDYLKPWEVIADRLAAAARVDMVIAVYNPASRTRRWQVARARDILLTYRDPHTPVVVGRDVGGADERVQVVTLGSLDPDTIDMRCLLIVGSSKTRVVNRGATEPIVYTPRRYEVEPGAC
jgi:precorrin-2 C20-methyltransferase / precorrin-3B C17-methyltransferase